MERRLVEELRDLEIGIQNIESSYAKMHAILDKLLASPDKAFEVTFRNVQYNFIYPTTQSEMLEMNKLREKLLAEIFSYCMAMMCQDTSSWWMVTAFASGIDTLDMRLEKVSVDELVNQLDQDGNPISSIPLNEENYQVKQELEYNAETFLQD